jgi:hypothetical protein
MSSATWESPSRTLGDTRPVFDTDVGHAAATFAAYLERADTDARLRQLES